MADNAPSSTLVHVVAGILRDAQGRVLLAQRPEGKQDSGCWEFPGGKVEQGESPEAALVRELDEELGIRVRVGRRRIAIAHPPIRLDVHEIESCVGIVRAREGQRLSWIEPERIDRMCLPVADRPVVTSLCLPDRYLITPSPQAGEETAFLAAIESALDAGIRLIQLRLAGWPRQTTAPLARRVRDICRAGNARIVLNGDWQLAAVLGLDGVHLPARIAHALSHRPLSEDLLVGVSCHDPGELAHAAVLGADYATLSPIAATASHPAAAVLGWSAAQTMLAPASLPVYALGGLGLSDLPMAFSSGFQGVAAIRAFWPDA